MKDVGTEQWEPATNVGATSATLQSSVKNNNNKDIYIYTQTIKNKIPKPGIS